MTHIAQINIGIMVAPTDDPTVAEFMDNLDRINAVADDAPGFVWRLQTDEGNATDIQIFPNPLQLVNMSVWESVSTLKQYVYRTEHVDFFRRRSEWFERDGKRVALWSVPVGSVPLLDEAVRRVEFLERHDSSPYAFGFNGSPTTLTFEAAGSAGAVEVRALLDGVLVGTGRVDVGGEGSGVATLSPETMTDDELIVFALIDQLELQAARLGITELEVRSADTTVRTSTLSQPEATELRIV